MIFHAPLNPLQSIQIRHRIIIFYVVSADQPRIDSDNMTGVFYRLEGGSRGQKFNRLLRKLHLEIVYFPYLFW